MEKVSLNSVVFILGGLLTFIFRGTHTSSSPRFTQEPSSAVALKNHPFLFNCSATGNPPPVISWQRNGITITKDEAPRKQVFDNGTLYISRIIHRRKRGDTRDSGSYRCFASNKFGTLASRQAELKVALKPFLKAIPRVLSVIRGNVARMECVTSGLLMDISWSKIDDGVLSEQKDSRVTILPSGVLQLYNTRHSDMGQYRCFGRNGLDNFTSNLIQLNIVEAAPSEKQSVSFVFKPKNISVVLGQPLVVECIASGGGEKVPMVVWSKTSRLDLPLAVKEGGSNLNITEVTTADAGEYLCLAVLSREDNISHKMVVNILVPPRFRIKPQNQTRPANITNLVKFTCSASGNPVPRLTWFKDGEVVVSSRRVVLSRRNNGLQLEITKLLQQDAGVYQCFAENSAGVVHTSAVLAIRETTRLGKPLHVQGKPISDTRILVTWSPPVTSDTIHSYTVHYKRVDQDTDDTVKIIDAPSTYYELTNLEVNCKYSISLKAYTFTSIGDMSTVIYVSTKKGTPPYKAPISITVASNLPGSLDLSWQPPPRKDTNGEISHYSILFRHLPNGQVTYKTVPRQLTATIGNLIGGKEYEVQVAAGTASGFGPYTKPLKQTVIDIEPKVLHSPKEVSLRCVNSSSILISWLPPSVHDILGYKLFHEDMDSWEPKPIGPLQIPAKKTDFILSDLLPHTRYKITLKAWNENGEGIPVTGAINTDVNMPSPPCFLPAPPVNIICKGKTATSIQVTWDEPGSTVTGYSVKYGVKGSSKPLEMSVDTEKTEVILEKLTPGLEYDIRVRSLCSRVDIPGPISNVLSGCQTAGPGIPRNLSFEYKRVNYIILSWYPPFKSTVTKYRVKYTTDNSQDIDKWEEKVEKLNFFSKFDNKMTLPLVKDKALVDATYYVKVRAENDAGNGLYAESIVIPPYDVIFTPESGNLAPNTKERNDDSLKLGVIIGCVLSVFFLVMLLIFLIWRDPCSMRSDQRRKPPVTITGRIPPNPSVGNRLENLEMSFMSSGSETKPGYSDCSSSSQAPYWNHCQCCPYRQRLEGSSSMGNTQTTSNTVNSVCVSENRNCSRSNVPQSKLGVGVLTTEGPSGSAVVLPVPTSNIITTLEGRAKPETKVLDTTTQIPSNSYQVTV